MLQLSKSLLNRPIISLRTGSSIGTTQGTIINPNNLKIEGFYCFDAFNKRQRAILLYQDIRDIGSQGIFVNDHEVLTHPDELIRLKEIIAHNFELLGKPVVTVNKTKLGKVSDYAVEAETMYVQKIYVARSVFKSLSMGSLSVDRSQIVEITSRRIIIQEPLQGVPATSVAQQATTSLAS